ncbi:MULTISPECIES: hypothetical protein [Bacillales]|jgi:hypothetical protein|uniref:Uncharacterized protein n=1 Tax=Caldibacillus debilis TaxID=301148 RepID=A0A150MF70_9BACI|nr:MULTISPECIES: hypothetical protein [Bacillaceae]KYD23170.1 hypothetical protein B4135_0993 [Caldibacillus debilis]OUM91096.1 MAG: hypothetical protein BAA00_16570 [Parageobacillus thermoglucosidasius]
MSKETLQGRFNAQKEKFLSMLKKKGVYKGCNERGFLYEIIGPIYGKDHRFVVALKSGKIYVIEMEAV